MEHNTGPKGPNFLGVSIICGKWTLSNEAAECVVLFYISNFNINTLYLSFVGRREEKKNEIYE